MFGRILSNRRVPVIHYRAFRNTDPPGLVQVWNEALTGRGAVSLSCPSLLEELILAKPYFDPKGLIVALDDTRIIGYIHAGFGPNASHNGLMKDIGVLCLVVVRPEYQRRGIGTELLRRGEAYLQDAGAQTILAGPCRPLSPFYLGIYGGSDAPGFLQSDSKAALFFGQRGYIPERTRLILHRLLDAPGNVVDTRFPAIRKRYELGGDPHRAHSSWYREGMWGPIDLVDLCLVEKDTLEVAARVSVWEMAGFTERWSTPAVGFLDLEVTPPQRRQGMGKFLVSSLMRHVRDQYFQILEVQIEASDTSMAGLCRALGFQEVDRGIVYRKV